MGRLLSRGIKRTRNLLGLPRVTTDSIGAFLSLILAIGMATASTAPAGPKKKTKRAPAASTRHTEIIPAPRLQSAFTYVRDRDSLGADQAFEGVAQQAHR